MLEKMINASTDYLVSHQVINEENRDIYEYGFHVLYNNLIDIISIVIIALCLNMMPEIIIYHVSFILLRNTAGGYHAKTHVHCFVLSTAILLVSLFIISQATSPVLSIGLACISVLLVWTKTPIEHENNPMSTKKQKRMKKISRTISVMLLCVILWISMFMDTSFRWMAISLALGMASHTCLVLAALFQFYHKK